MIYYLTAFLNGFCNSINRMTNVKAGQLFGTGNGALINYVEATFLSLALVFLTGSGGELTAAHMAAVPLWVYLGSVCGLVAQLMQIFATPKTNTMISSILMLAGNMASALVLDYLFFDMFSVGKVAGICLILCGAAWIERSKTEKA